MKKNGGTAAVIDIGSSELKMCVGQLKKDRVELLDTLEHPLRLGHEVFHDGKISFESIRELSRLLSGFARIMTEYGVTQYQVVATTALREAENRDYVLDQLKIRNDMEVAILEEEQEKTLIYAEILRGGWAKKKQYTLISHIGSGSLGLALHDGEHMVFSQNIPIGPLKLHDLLGELSGDTKVFHIAVEEYLSTMIRRLSIPRIEGGIGNLALTGSEVRLIAKACGCEERDGVYLLSPAALHELFSRIQSMQPEKIGDMFGISEESAELLYSALIIYIYLARLTDAEHIYAPRIELWDGLLRQQLISKAAQEYGQHVAENALSCAVMLASRYQCGLAHAEQVRGFSCVLFDRTQAVHGLGRRYRILLETAAVLSDCGYFVNPNVPAEAAFETLKNTGIYGLTSEEMRMVAAVVAFGREDGPDRFALEKAGLDQGKRLIVSKLGAILRLADALDRSQTQKLTSIRAKLEKDQLLIQGESRDSLCLEKWAFDRNLFSFEEVFGVRPCLKVKTAAGFGKEGKA